MPAKTKRKKTASAKSKYDARRANAFSVIIFALGLLIAAFSIPFETSSGFLLAIRHFLSGMFGLAVFFVGPLLIYFAVMISANKRSSLAEKTVVSLLFLLIFCGIIQVAVGLPEGEDFFKKFASLYSLGTAYKGGGVLSALFGWSLLALFKSKILSMFVLILAAFVLFMIVSGFTLIQFFKFVSKPFVWIYKKVKSAFENLGKDADEEKERRQRSAREKKFDEIASNISSQPEGSAQAVPDNPIVNAVIGKKEPDKAPDEPQAKAPESNQESIEDIIKNVISDSPAEEKPEQQESINLKEEEAKITEEVENEEKPRAVYQIPPISLLNPPAVSAQGTDIQRELKSNAENLVNTLKSFGVETRVININRGPAVTRYELQPSAGVKISKITNLADDIALNLAAAGVRIEAPIPNKPAVGIEVPNKSVDMVTLREIIDSKEFADAKSKLSVAFGRDIAGNVVVGDLSKMPHLLIAGATGSGKSVCINSIIMSLIYKSTPDEVKIILVDPKVVELSVYNGIPHLLIPVVTDPRKAAGALSWAVTQMLSRYKLFADNNVRDLKGYNEVAKYNDELEVLPQIVIVIDELADLMMAAPNEVEDSICRLAQMARAAGMYLVIATQRPSVDVITGIIKANIPSRIAFAVSSQVDSRTILDQAGAEKLLGRGDMLYYPVGMPKPARIQNSFVSDKEVESVVNFIKDQARVDYDETIIKDIESHAPVGKADGGSASASGDMSAQDEFLESAIELVVESGQASTSSLQRKFKLGYARAARIIDAMEEMGIVGPLEGNKRQVLMSKQQWYEMKMNKAESDDE